MKHVLIAVMGVLLLAVGCAAPTPAATENPHSPEIAIKAMQKMARLPDLPAQFTGMTAMADSPGGDLQVASYTDSAGRIFSLDPVSDQVVAIDARAAIPNALTKTPLLSEPELKNKAEALARAATPKFDKLISGLDYNLISEGDLYSFEWRSRDKGQWAMPPFIRVTLYVSGDLAGYVNTVILPQ